MMYILLLFIIHTCIIYRPSYAWLLWGSMLYPCCPGLFWNRRLWKTVKERTKTFSEKDILNSIESI